jgi:hypothetical protein
MSISNIVFIDVPMDFILILEHRSVRYVNWYSSLSDTFVRLSRVTRVIVDVSDQLSIRAIVERQQRIQ